MLTETDVGAFRGPIVPNRDLLYQRDGIFEGKLDLFVDNAFEAVVLMTALVG